jgi:aromatic ring-cleaving dioxygenase
MNMTSLAKHKPPETELAQLEWHDPREKIWGFHVHQELPLDDFTKALVVQEDCHAFLKSHDVPVDAADVIAPGYGPHLDYMWELRVENAPRQSVLEKLGLAISYMAINRFGLSAYIHPLMHDTALPAEAALAEEGRDNQTNALWFGHRVPQKQEFFFNPPKDAANNIVDTRTPRIVAAKERAELLTAGKSKLQGKSFQSPEKIIVHGFHIHMDYTPAQAQLALTIFDRFLVYLLGIGMRPTSTRLYAPRENGPHVQGGWEVKFETEDKTILADIGIAIGWLMCNRQGLSLFMHPVTWQEGDYREEHKSHAEYAFFLGDLPELDLSFFTDKF